MTAAAEKTICFARKKNQDWFDENEETVSRPIEAKLRGINENTCKHQWNASEDLQKLRTSVGRGNAKLCGPTRLALLLCHNRGDLQAHKVISGWPEEHSWLYDNRHPGNPRSLEVPFREPTYSTTTHTFLTISSKTPHCSPSATGCPCRPGSMSSTRYSSAAMFNEIPLDSPSINIRYRLDGRLFNLSRLHSKTRTSTISVCKMQYADDNATPSQTADGLQRTDNRMTRYSDEL
ncbi:Hypothetical predicted protein [Octopus vulgaris]|uniref:Uncharacterized protein n=1 Tax=Octopus vulgaris TaxID=6645 RepID=A0AA36F520_OCTVU|nr:Hypothetical predicted protein [Octopus vulgaris]